MNLPVQRFNLKLGIGGNLFPHPEGEWCRYDEACSALELALGELVVKQATGAVTGIVPVVACDHVIPLDKEGRSNTYCMKPVGHTGKCYGEIKK